MSTLATWGGRGERRIWGPREGQWEKDGVAGVAAACGAAREEARPSVQRPRDEMSGLRSNPLWGLTSEHEGCYLSLGHSQSLEDSSFNMTTKTLFIIHRWTMSSIFENWLYKLVSALHTREKEAIVVVVDWLPLAHQLYMDAVNNTRVVGHSTARMLHWLQVPGDERESPVASRTSNPNPLKKYTLYICCHKLLESDKNLWD
nr:endothelial lipase-like isoform X1 [Gorilla gorilla gorilla]